MSHATMNPGDRDRVIAETRETARTAAEAANEWFRLQFVADFTGLRDKRKAARRAQSESLLCYRGLLWNMKILEELGLWKLAQEIHAGFDRDTALFRERFVASEIASGRVRKSRPAKSVEALYEPCPN